MYKIVLLIMATFLFATTQQQQLEKLTQEVETLKKELTSLKKEQKKDYDELYDFSEEVETKVLEDKLKLGLWLKFGDDFIRKTYADGREYENDNLLTTKLMINLKADITKNIKFYGRLSMYKYWGSSVIHPYSYYDNMQGRVPSDSGIYAERAYMDWFLFQNTALPVALTLGRQPSGDGPSHQFKDNVSRKATYSALLYDGVADGAIVTFNLSKLLHYRKTYLRLGYSKGFGYVNSDTITRNAYIGASNNAIKDTNLYGVFFDTKLPNISNSLVQLSYSKMTDIIANPLDTNYSNNGNIGDMDLFGAMIEITNFYDKHLDLFAHYGYNKSHPNGKSYTIVTPLGTPYNISLLGLNGDIQSKTGSAYWLGARYALGEGQLFKVGFEYNHGSKNWVSLTQGGYDLYNKLSTRGDAYEAYFLYLYNRNLNFRLGYIGIDYDYTGSGWFVGESFKISDITAPNDSMVIDKLRALYLKMNLIF